MSVVRAKVRVHRLQNRGEYRDGMMRVALSAAARVVRDGGTAKPPWQRAHERLISIDLLFDGYSEQPRARLKSMQMLPICFRNADQEPFEIFLRPPNRNNQKALEMVEEAVICEPVSPSRFPANREKYREFTRIRPLSADSTG